MSEWNFFDYASKDDMLGSDPQQSDEFLALAGVPADGGADRLGSLAGP